MVNKKGIVRIIEASLAVLIVITFLIIVNYRESANPQADFGSRITVILEEIARDSELRTNILEYDLTISRLESPNKEILERIYDYASVHITNTGIDYAFSICGLESSCPLPIEEYPETRGNIYAADRIISATLEDSEFSPKRIKIFIWTKG